MQQPQRNALGSKGPKRHEGTGWYSSNKRETNEKKRWQKDRQRKVGEPNRYRGKEK